MGNIVLVTGAYGFIGRHIAKIYKSNGYFVIGMGHGVWNAKESNDWGLDKWYDCDVTLENLLRFADIPQYIIHCAGGSSVGQSMKNPTLDFQRTVATTQGVLEYIRTYAASAKMIYLSSAAVYGTVDRLPIQENDLLNPISPYGIHKKVSEDLCRYYCKQYGIKGSIVRLFSVYGNGLKKQLLWDACNKIGVGENHFFGTGEEKRDWIHVEDVAKLVYKVGKNVNSSCPIVNGANGISISVKEILENIFVAFQSPSAPSFDGKVDIGNPREYIADVKKALAYDWTPEINISEGIKAYVEWYKRQ